MATVHNDKFLSRHACLTCKKRKVRCDRILPFCAVCDRTRQQCEYPSESSTSRPGPKIGSQQRRKNGTRPRSRTRARREFTPETSGSLSERQGSRQNDFDAASPIQGDAGLAARTSPFDNTTSEFNLPSPVTTPLDVCTLSYIVHPSHDLAAITTEEFTPPPGRTNTRQQDLPASACSILGVTLSKLQEYIDLYFENMSAISLFHQPTFQSKLESIESEGQMVALLASMLSFAAKFDFKSKDSAGWKGSQNSMQSPWANTQKRFQKLALQYINESMEDYSDEAPTLCLLQALVLLTFRQLIEGVRGSAWRRMGLCIRIAHELGLHHIDRYNTPEETKVSIWCDLEERRRLWWAIWELDIFASTTKRCPSGIDPSDNDTRLPVSDECWFSGKFKPSCFLEIRPMNRIKALQQSGNDGVTAWNIVLNSLMRQGHAISKFRSSRPGNGRYRPLSMSMSEESTSDTLAILANALSYYALALPSDLQYSGEYLSFPTQGDRASLATRRSHIAKYKIHIATQLARLMIYHEDTARGAQQDLHLPATYGNSRIPNSNINNANNSASQTQASLRLGPSRHGLQQYHQAADELLNIISRSSRDHVRYVSPFYASAAWHGAAFWLTWKVFAPRSTNFDLVDSKLEIMRVTLNNFAEFWGLPDALLENLNTMDAKTRRFIMPIARAGYHGHGHGHGHGSTNSNSVHKRRGENLEGRNGNTTAEVRRMQNLTGNEFNNSDPMASSAGNAIPSLTHRTTTNPTNPSSAPQNHYPPSADHEGMDVLEHASLMTPNLIEHNPTNPNNNNNNTNPSEIFAQTSTLGVGRHINEKFENGSEGGTSNDAIMFHSNMYLGNAGLKMNVNMQNESNVQQAFDFQFVDGSSMWDRLDLDFEPLVNPEAFLDIYRGN